MQVTYYSSLPRISPPKAQPLKFSASPAEDISMFFEGWSPKAHSHTSSPKIPAQQTVNPLSLSEGASSILAPSRLLPEHDSFNQDGLWGASRHLDSATAAPPIPFSSASFDFSMPKGVLNPFATQPGSMSAPVHGVKTESEFSPPPFLIKRESGLSNFQRETPAPTEFSMPPVSQLGLYSQVGSQALPVDLTMGKNQFSHLLRDMNAALPDDGTLGTKRDKARLERNAIRVEQDRRSISPELLDIIQDQKEDLEEQKAGKPERKQKRIERSVAELEQLRLYLSGLMRGKKRTLEEADEPNTEPFHIALAETKVEPDIRASVEKSEAEAENSPSPKRQKRSLPEFKLGPEPQEEKALQKKIDAAEKAKKDYKTIIRPLKNNLAAAKSRRRKQEYTEFLENQLGIKKELAEEGVNSKAASVNSDEETGSKKSESPIPDLRPKKKAPAKNRGAKTSTLSAGKIESRVPVPILGRPLRPKGTENIGDESKVVEEPQTAILENANPAPLSSRGAQHLVNSKKQPLLLPKASASEIRKPVEEGLESAESDDDMSSPSSESQTLAARGGAAVPISKSGKAPYMRPKPQPVEYNGKLYRSDYEATRARNHDTRRAELKEKGYWDDDRNERHRADSPMEPVKKERRVGGYQTMQPYGDPDAEGLYRHDYLGKNGERTTENGKLIRKSKKKK